MTYLLELVVKHTNRMDNLKSEDIGNIIKYVQTPIILKNTVKWPLLEWSIDDWLENMNSKEYPFRCKPDKPSNDPCWERNCTMKMSSFEKFVAAAQNDGNHWQYFDYKYMQQWFKPDSALYQQISWDCFGFPAHGAAESTLWVGSRGAHTPCHQDTYGFNIVVQVFGIKRWLLFPPESGAMKPTRVPYEESSIYSQHNFASPKKLSDFNGLSNCRMVELKPGDALVVPPRWWHYVEHISPIGITINTWIPNEPLDAESRVEEALTRLLVAQICKDLPEKRLPTILNPNEDDLPEFPLTVAILQVESTVSKCLEYRTKKIGSKRIKLSENSTLNTKDVSNVDKSINEIIQKHHHTIMYIEEISTDNLHDILKENMGTNRSTQQDKSEDETDGEDNDDDTNNDAHLTSAIINSFCQPNVIGIIKDNLLSQFS